MITSVRAALSAAMLVGFYVYALAIAGGLFVGTALLIEVLPGAVLGKLLLVTLAVPFAILVATWRLIRAKTPPPEGLKVRPGRAPGLWAEARAIAAAVGTRPPDEIRLVPEVNAAVSERTHLLGVIGGRRYLYIGVPLLQALTVSQLRAVLAHEFGHYSHSHTRLGA
ncbi:MAG TPA: M48 family metallopeptidase [Jiangellaceae bacterium]|nr:M48 family metallopeptidase [Jiangellaceae bacterium]